MPELMTNGQKIKQIMMEVTAASCIKVFAKLGMSYITQQLYEANDLISPSLESLPSFTCKNFNGQPSDTIDAIGLADIRGQANAIELVYLSEY